MRGGYGWFYQIAHLQRQCLRNTALHCAALRARIHQRGLQQQSLQPAAALPDHDARLCAAHADLAAFRSRRRPGLPGPAAAAMEPERADAPAPRTLSLDLGYVGSAGDRLLIAQGLNQPLLASPAHPVNCGYDGVAGDCITTNTSQNAQLRVPDSGRDTDRAGGQRIRRRLRLSQPAGDAAPAGLARPGISGDVHLLARRQQYHDLQRSRTIWRSIGRARPSIARTASTLNFDYHLPAPAAARCGKAGRSPASSSCRADCR